MIARNLPGIAVVFALSAQVLGAGDSHLVMLGTYTAGGSEGIYRIRLDGETGALSEPELAARTPNPSFLTLSPDERFLYASGEVGGTGGGVAAFAFHRSNGHLRLLNVQPTAGAPTIFVAVDSSDRWAFAVSGSSAAVIEFPVLPDGSLGPRVRSIPIKGPPGPIADRQQRPFPHSLWFSPDDRFLFVPDLGSDRIHVLRFDAATGSVEPGHPEHVALPPGTGPRHAKFSADGRFFYVLGELSGTVTAFRYEPALGLLTALQHVSALPEDFHGRNTASEIRIHPNGRFLYTANRGHNSLAVFARDPESGLLSRIEIVPSGGDFPRNFGISPDGRWLLCAHQASDNLTVFRIDQETGLLTRTSSAARVPKAICVLFVD